MQAMNITKTKTQKQQRNGSQKVKSKIFTQNWIKNSKLRNDIRAEEGVVP